MIPIHTKTLLDFWKLENEQRIFTALKKLGSGEDFASFAARLYFGYLTKEERRKAEWYPFAQETT
jgi:hypothetical protein